METMSTCHTKILLSQNSRRQNAPSVFTWIQSNEKNAERVRLRGAKSTEAIRCYEQLSCKRKRSAALDFRHPILKASYPEGGIMSFATSLGSMRLNIKGFSSLTTGFAPFAVVQKPSRYEAK